MSRSSTVLSLALVFAGVAVSSAFSQDKPVPTRIAFVDFKKAFDTYRKAATVRNQLKDKADALSAEFKKRAAEIDQQAEKMNTMNAGSDEYDKVQREVTIARDMLKYDRESASRRFDQEQQRQKAALVKEIFQEAENLRAERGWAAVFPFLPADSIEDDFLAARGVLARDESLDVTKEVVDRLNQLLPPAPPK
jgi:Skp family chaperone for outer membrane proteins